MRFPWVALLGLAAAAGAAAADPAAIERDGLRQLLTIQRVYVDRLTGGETAAQMRDILISALDGAKLFVMTDNQDRADFILRGAAEDLVFTDEHSSSDGIDMRASVGTGTGRTTSSRTSRSQGVGVGFGDNESDRSTERRHEAIAAVRLVNKDGDVVWSTTQESLGAKFRGASADVADKITAKLKDDFDKAKKLGQ